MRMKKCSKCKKIKQKCDFSKSSRTKSGLRHNCKECQHKEYAENKEKLSRNMREYYGENKDKISENQKKYYEKHKGKIKKRRIRYYKKNKEKELEYSKYYRNTTDGKLSKSVSDFKRRALKRTTSDGTITKNSLRELLKCQNNKCAECEKELNFNIDRAVHLDHHIPISRGGTHTIGNVRYVCQKCNLSKGNIIPATLNLI